jgi:hypothetical protein
LKPTRNLISIGLALALILPVESLPAQDQGPAPLPAAINLVVMDGEGAISNIRQRASKDPVVQVEDNAHHPITGAAVVFTLPTEGATGEFGGGSKSLTVNTDIQGQAKANGLKLGGIGGKLPIRVTASYRGLSARTTITQFIEVPPGVKPGNPKSHGKLIAVLLAVGGAGAAGAIIATQHKSSSTSTPTTPTNPTGPTPIGITPGTGTISPPR